MIRDDTIETPLRGNEAHLHIPEAKVWVTVGGVDREEIEHHARRIEAGVAVIQAVIPLLRAVRNGLSKRAYASFEPHARHLGPGTSAILREAVMDAINVDDVELLSMIPTRTHTLAP